MLKVIRNFIKEIRYDLCYLSKEEHNSAGFGLCLEPIKNKCKNCYHNFNKLKEKSNE